MASPVGRGVETGQPQNQPQPRSAEPPRGPENRPATENARPPERNNERPAGRGPQKKDERKNEKQ